MSVGFEKILLMQNPLNLESSQVIQTYVYDIGLLNGQFSYSTAVGLFNSVINFVILIVLTDSLGKRVQVYGKGVSSMRIKERKSSTKIYETRMIKYSTFAINYSSGFLSLLFLIPLIYIISASISNPSFVNSGEMWLFPKGITFEGFQRVFESKEIWVGYRNTIFYTLLGTFINLAVTLPCAYALSRAELVGKGS